MVSLALRNGFKILRFRATSDFFVREQSIELYRQDTSVRFLLADFFHKSQIPCYVMYKCFRKEQRKGTKNRDRYPS